MSYLSSGKCFDINTRKQAVYWTPLPMLILGVPTLLAGGLALRLTETSKRDLPTTLKDATKMEEEAHHIHHQEVEKRLKAENGVSWTAFVAIILLREKSRV